jgi:hypothetical protein
MSKALSTLALITLLSISSISLSAQKTKVADSQAVRTDLRVRLEKSVVIPFEMSGPLLNPYRCNENGIYYRRVGLDDGLRDPIKMVDQAGELKTTFDIQQAGVDFYSVDYFISEGGELSALGWQRGSRSVTGVFVAAFGKDGAFKSATKLAVPESEAQTKEVPVTFPTIAPHTLGVFPDGDFLITGLTIPTTKATTEGGVPVRHPYTAVFRSDGSLVKEVNFRDDKRIEDAIDQGDHSTVPDGSREAAFTGGSIIEGIDGNLYLWRRTSPLLIYVVSPAAEILRTIKIAAPKNGMMPDNVVAYKGSLAVLFVMGLNGEKKIVVTDQQTGELRDSFDVDNDLGVALTCYTPPDFVFLGTDHGRLCLRRANVH